MKILFAEDGEVSYKVLDKYFQRWGYDYIGVRNGKEAWEVLKQENPPKIALLDWMMPEMDGLEVCKKVCSKSYNNMIHIIMVTTKSDNTSIIEALDAGASDYVSKPYDPKILKARIEAGVRIIQLNQELMRYLKQVENIANIRAKQLIHSDRLATIGTLTSGIAHEINNPTTFISVNVQTLEDMWPFIHKVIESAPDSEEKRIVEDVSKEMNNIFNNMKKGVHRIKSIIDSLKNYYRSDKNTKRKMSDIAEVINEGIHFCNNRLKNDIETKVIIEENLPEIKINSREIEQVLVNLILNAADSMKLSEEKKLTITASAEKDYIKICVRDTGCGVSHKDQKNIFRPFYTTKGVDGGTGMGLPISKNIIENHNGVLKMEPVEAGGTEFVIKLPIEHKGK